MSENPNTYTDREIDHLFGDIKASLNRIEVQTTKHNGRLTRLERYMWTLVGAVTIIGFVIANNLITFAQ